MDTPSNIFLFVTNLCNLYCEHCFYHAELNKNREGLTVDQIKRIAKSLTRPAFVCLTGGEPMLRKDLEKLVKILYQDGGCEYLNICTNGYYPERVLDFTSQVLENINLRSLTFQISLDGDADMHNAVRQNRFSYRKAFDTIKLLKKLKATYSQLDVSVLTVITRHNFDRTAELLHETQGIGIKHGFSIVRGNYSVFNLPDEAASGFNVADETATIGVSLEEWKSKIQELKDMREKFAYSSPSDLNLRKLEVTIETLEQKARVIPCYAGTLDGVIYPNGDVAFCETSRPFANLRDANYNLHELWNSVPATTMREKITGCACIHACNLVTSLQLQSNLR